MKKNRRFYQYLLLLLFLLPSIGTVGQDAVGVRLGKTVRYVSPNGRNAGNKCLLPGNPCQTIGYALSVCVPGDILQLAEGTYTEANTITKANLTIQGAGRNKTLIRGPAGTYQAILTQKANDLAVLNLTLSNDKALYEGISVNGATKGLQVNNVVFENIGNPSGLLTEGGGGHGIRVRNVFSELEITNCQFRSAYVGIPSVSVGIGVSTTAKISNALVQNCGFKELFAGFVSSGPTDGLLIAENEFGPMDPQDAFGGSSSIYLGDLQGSLSNILIAQNSFTEYARGIYVNNYSTAGAGTSLVKNLEIRQNEFNNSILSSPVRVITSSGATIEQLAIVENSFNQSQANYFADGLAMIDIRQGTRTASQQSDNIRIDQNCIYLTGGPYGKATWGILLRGQTYKVQIRQNYLSGGKVGGTTPNAPGTSGIVVQTNFAEPFGPMPAGAELDCSSNYINGFENGLIFYDRETQLPGGLPANAKVLINQNELSDNEVAIYSGYEGSGIAAPSNWFGITDTNLIKNTLVLGNVAIAPVLRSGEDLVPGTCGNGFQPRLTQSDQLTAVGADAHPAQHVPPLNTVPAPDRYPTVAQNFPNPFTSQTILPFWLPREQQVWLRVYDISGKLVLEKTATLPQGPQQFELNAAQLQEGRMWYYQIGGADWVETKQMMRF